MSDSSKHAEKSTDADADAPIPEKRKRQRPSGEKMKAGSNAIRVKIASVIWLVAVICALFLAVGALLVALKMNQDNSIVGFIIDGAKKLDFGEFKTFDGKDAAIRSALTNWGLAAVIYLVGGKIVDRIIRP